MRTIRPLAVLAALACVFSMVVQAPPALAAGDTAAIKYSVDLRTERFPALPTTYDTTVTSEQAKTVNAMPQPTSSEDQARIIGWTTRDSAGGGQSDPLPYIDPAQNTGDVTAYPIWVLACSPDDSNSCIETAGWNGDYRVNVKATSEWVHTGNTVSVALNPSTGRLDFVGGSLGGVWDVDKDQPFDLGEYFWVSDRQGRLVSLREGLNQNLPWAKTFTAETTVSVGFRVKVTNDYGPTWAQGMIQGTKNASGAPSIARETYPVNIKGFRLGDFGMLNQQYLDMLETGDTSAFGLAKLDATQPYIVGFLPTDDKAIRPDVPEMFAGYTWVDEHGRGNPDNPVNIDPASGAGGIEIPSGSVNGKLMLTAHWTQPFFACTDDGAKECTVEGVVPDGWSPADGLEGVTVDGQPVNPDEMVQLDLMGQRFHVIMADPEKPDEKQNLALALKQFGFDMDREASAEDPNVPAPKKAERTAPDTWTYTYKWGEDYQRVYDPDTGARLPEMNEDGSAKIDPATGGYVYAKGPKNTKQLQVKINVKVKADPIDLGYAGIDNITDSSKQSLPKAYDMLSADPTTIAEVEHKDGVSFLGWTVTYPGEAETATPQKTIDIPAGKYQKQIKLRAHWQQALVCATDDCTYQAKVPAGWAPGTDPAADVAAMLTSDGSGPLDPASLVTFIDSDGSRKSPADMNLKPTITRAGDIWNVTYKSGAISATVKVKPEVPVTAITYVANGVSQAQLDALPQQYKALDPAQTVKPVNHDKGIEFAGWTADFPGAPADPTPTLTIPAGLAVPQITLTAHWKPGLACVQSDCTVSPDVTADWKPADVIVTDRDDPAKKLFQGMLLGGKPADAYGVVEGYDDQGLPVGGLYDDGATSSIQRNADGRSWTVTYEWRGSSKTVTVTPKVQAGTIEYRNTADVPGAEVAKLPTTYAPLSTDDVVVGPVSNTNGLKFLGWTVEHAGAPADQVPAQSVTLNAGTVRGAVVLTAHWQRQIMPQGAGGSSTVALTAADDWTPAKGLEGLLDAKGAQVTVPGLVRAFGEDGARVPDDGFDAAGITTELVRNAGTKAFTMTYRWGSDQPVTMTLNVTAPDQKITYVNVDDANGRDLTSLPRTYNVLAEKATTVSPIGNIHGTRFLGWEWTSTTGAQGSTTEDPTQALELPAGAIRGDITVTAKWQRTIFCTDLGETCRFTAKASDDWTPAKGLEGLKKSDGTDLDPLALVRLVGPEGTALPAAGASPEVTYEATRTGDSTWDVTYRWDDAAAKIVTLTVSAEPSPITVVNAGAGIVAGGALTLPDYSVLAQADQAIPNVEHVYGQDETAPVEFLGWTAEFEGATEAQRTQPARDLVLKQGEIRGPITLTAHYSRQIQRVEPAVSADVVAASVDRAWTPDDASLAGMKNHAGEQMTPDNLVRIIDQTGAVRTIDGDQAAKAAISRDGNRWMVTYTWPDGSDARTITVEPQVGDAMIAYANVENITDADLPRSYALLGADDVSIPDVAHAKGAQFLGWTIEAATGSTTDPATAVTLPAGKVRGTTVTLPSGEKADDTILLTAHWAPVILCGDESCGVTATVPADWTPTDGLDGMTDADGGALTADSLVTLIGEDGAVVPLADSGADVQIARDGAKWTVSYTWTVGGRTLTKTVTVTPAVAPATIVYANVANATEDVAGTPAEFPTTLDVLGGDVVLPAITHVTGAEFLGWTWRDTEGHVFSVPNDHAVLKAGTLRGSVTVTANWKRSIFCADGATALPDGAGCLLADTPEHDAVYVDDQWVPRNDLNGLKFPVADDAPEGTKPVQMTRDNLVTAVDMDGSINTPTAFGAVVGVERDNDRWTVSYTWGAVSKTVSIQPVVEDDAITYEGLTAEEAETFGLPTSYNVLAGQPVVFQDPTRDDEWFKGWTFQAPYGTAKAEYPVSGLQIMPGTARGDLTMTANWVFKADPQVIRYAGQNRYLTATWANRDHPSDRGNEVFVVTGTNFADAVSVTPAAVKVGGAVFLADPKKGLIAEDVAEIKKRNPSKVWLIGGPNVVSNDVRTQLVMPTERIYGKTRYETSLKVIEQFWGKTNKVYLATGTGFADALSVGPLAGTEGTPIMLVDPKAKSLTPEQMAVFSETGELNVTAVGGRNAISPELLDVPGALTDRISGRDRYETSAMVADRYPRKATNVWMATGENFPDALVAGVIAGRAGEPVVLTPTGSDLPDSIAEVLKKFTTAQYRYVMGGESWVSSTNASSVLVP